MRVKTMPNVITTAEQLTKMVADYLERPAFCYDLETAGDTRLNPRRNIVQVMSLATDGRHDVVPMAFTNGEFDSIEYPLTASGKARKQQVEEAGKEFQPRKSDYSSNKALATLHFHAPPAHLSAEEAFAILRPLMMSDRTKVGQNLKFDLGSTYKYLGAFPAPPYADTMVAAYLINSGWPIVKGTGWRPYGLASIAERETGYVMQKGVGANISLHPWDDVMRYAAIDAKFTWLSWRMLRRKIKSHGLQEVMDLEMDILEVLIHMERTGAPIDQQALRELEDRLMNHRTGLLVLAEAKVYELAGKRFAIGGTDAKADIIFGAKEDGGQGLKPTLILKSGKSSVDRDSIKVYRRSNAFVGALMDYNDLAKVNSTYLKPYLYGTKVRGTETVQPLVYNGRIHADFVQTGAATGRFSCRAPNLQNVPNSNTEMGRALRGLFIAPPGHCLVVADFSQIELRVLAHFSQDTAMMRAFLNGEDIHQTTADALGIDRKGGKALNFAIVFGGGDQLIGEMAGVSTKKAATFSEAYSETYPGIPRWKLKVVNQCRREEPDPFVRTLTGRVRYLPDIRNSNEGFRASAERQASNTIVQGSAADIIKLSMVRAFRTLPDECDLILTVHDELVTIVPIEMADKAATVIGEAMQGSYPLSVPIPAAIKIVDRWSDAKS